jgi:hypothetical protein
MTVRQGATNTSGRGCESDGLKLGVSCAAMMGGALPWIYWVFFRLSNFEPNQTALRIRQPFLSAVNIVVVIVLHADANLVVWLWRVTTGNVGGLLYLLQERKSTNSLSPEIEKGFFSVLRSTYTGDSSSLYADETRLGFQIPIKTAHCESVWSLLCVYLRSIWKVPTFRSWAEYLERREPLNLLWTKRRVLIDRIPQRRKSLFDTRIVNLSTCCCISNARNVSVVAPSISAKSMDELKKVWSQKSGAPGAVNLLT